MVVFIILSFERVHLVLLITVEQCVQNGCRPTDRANQLGPSVYTKAIPIRLHLLSGHLANLPVLQKAPKNKAYITTV